MAEPLSKDACIRAEFKTDAWPNAPTESVTPSALSTSTRRVETHSKRGRKKKNKKRKSGGGDEQAHDDAAAKTAPCFEMLRSGACAREQCSFSHDDDALRAYVATLEPPIDAPCAVARRRGQCAHGFHCRYYADHSDAATLAHNTSFAVDAAVVAASQPLNRAPRDFLRRLRKKQVPTPRADAAHQLRSAATSTATTTTTTTSTTTTTTSAAPSATLIDAPATRLDLRGRLVLAPLTTVGTLPFRKMCVALGADVTVSEMAMGYNLLRGDDAEWSLLERDACERVFGVQVAATRFYDDTKAARVCEVLATRAAAGDFTADFVDLNACCPMGNIVSYGGGAALSEDARRLRAVLAGLAATSPWPVTVKLRTGATADASGLARTLPAVTAAASTVAAVFVHGRARTARYKKPADWTLLRAAADAHARPVDFPFVPNGDIYTWPQAARLLDAADADAVAEAPLAPSLTSFVPLDVGDGTTTALAPGALDAAVARPQHTAAWLAAATDASPYAALMIGRGAIIKPWLFTELKERRHIDMPAVERLALIRAYCTHSLDVWGADLRGVTHARRMLLEWLSFAHRYIPVGLLERANVLISDRKTSFRGRCELETLLASPFVADWRRIACMFLGPEPAGFTFVPRHNSQSYDNDVQG